MKPKAWETRVACEMPGCGGTLTVVCNVRSVEKRQVYWDYHCNNCSDTGNWAFMAKRNHASTKY